MLRKLTILLLLPILTGCLPFGSGTAVRGKVNFEKLPTAGIVVEAYRADAPHLSEQPAFRSAVTSADGLFRVELPPGVYYLFARGSDLFSYYGRNPVTVPAGGMADVNLGLVKTTDKTIEQGDDETVVGEVSFVGLAQADAVVFIYTDLTSQLKGMGYIMAGPTDERGRFEVSLPDGIYYLIARKRQGNTTVGPLRAGDFIGYYPKNPLRVRDNSAGPVMIPMLEVPDKIDQIGRNLNGQTSISGMIRNADGQPVSGVRAVLYETPQMLDRPLLVSQPTGVDGRYSLSMPKGGVYYLAARDTLGGAPGPGDLYGTFAGNPDHALLLENNSKSEGVDITVEKMW